jgi:hypothetical protein
MPLYPGNRVISCNWADRPTAAAAGVGARLYALDLNNAEWVSDGTRWRVQRNLLLMAFVAPSVSGASSISAGALETAFGTERVLPGGVIQAGDRLRWLGAFGAGTATESRTVQVRIGATSGAFTERLHRYVTAGSSVAYYIDRFSQIISDTAHIGPPTGVLGAAASTSLPVDITGMPSLASTTYLNFTATPSAGNAITPYYMALILEAGS